MAALKDDLVINFIISQHIHPDSSLKNPIISQYKLLKLHMFYKDLHFGMIFASQS